MQNVTKKLTLPPTPKKEALRFLSVKGNLYMDVSILFSTPLEENAQ